MSSSTPTTDRALRELLQVPEGFSWGQWAYARAIHWYWQETPESQLETLTDFDQLTRLPVDHGYHQKVAQMPCQARYLLARGDLDPEKHRKKACGEPFCPSCSIYRMAQMLRLLVNCPGPTLLYRESSWEEGTVPWTEAHSADWTINRNHLRILGWANFGVWTGSGPRTEVACQGRVGVWHSPREVARSGALTLPTDYPSGLSVHQVAFNPQEEPEQVAELVDRLVVQVRHPRGALMDHQQSSPLASRATVDGLEEIAEAVERAQTDPIGARGDTRGRISFKAKVLMGLNKVDPTQLNIT